jgi:LPXTG-motif cell wall-anchored protein
VRIGERWREAELEPDSRAGSADEWEDYGVMKKGNAWLSGGRAINLLIVGLVTMLVSLSAVEAAGTPTPVAGPTAGVTAVPKAPTSTPSQSGGVSPLSVTCDYSKLKPVLTCLDKIDDNNYVAHFGYENTNPQAETVAIGSANNTISGGGTRTGQPSTFQVGTKTDVVQVQFTAGQQVSWKLGNTTVTASSSSQPPCRVPTNTPTKTSTVTSTATHTPTKTPTNTPTVTKTPTNTSTVTNTPTNTATSTPTNTPPTESTSTPTSTPTNTPPTAPTSTPTSTPTNTPPTESTSTPTSTPPTAPTSTPTNTPPTAPTSTPTNTPTSGGGGGETPTPAPAAVSTVVSGISVLAAAPTAVPAAPTIIAGVQVLAPAALPKTGSAFPAILLFGGLSAAAGWAFRRFGR